MKGKKIIGILTCTLFVASGFFSTINSMAINKTDINSQNNILDTNNIENYYNRGYSITVDGNGNNYIIGQFECTVKFGDTTLISQGEYDVFVAKLNTNGVWQWAQRAGGSIADWGGSIDVDTNGNVYIVGVFKGTATFGATSLISQGEYDVFVAKLNTNGVWQWAQRAGGDSGDYSRGIAVDTSGNSYITGLIYGTAIFGTTTLYTQGNGDVFVAKLNTNGVWQWARSAGGNSNDDGQSIAVDSNGNVYVTGYYSGTATFGTDILFSSTDNMFIAKLNTNGVWQWVNDANRFDEGYTKGRGVAVDNSGNVYVTGIFTGTVGFGPAITLTCQDPVDVYVAKLNNNGAWLWANSIDKEQYYFGNHITVDSSGNICITGRSSDSIILYDMFIAKLNTNGLWLWEKNAEGSESCGMDVAMDTSSNVYITGYLRYNAIFGTITLDAQGSEDNTFVAKLNMNGVWQWAQSTGVNKPPNPPVKPSGPTSLKVDEIGTYSTYTTDPDGNQVQYQFDWGDGTISDWSLLVDSGIYISMFKTWNNTGIYQIKAHARDEFSIISDWSEPLTVKVLSVSANGPYKGITNYYVLFKGSISNGTPPYTWHWDFGDGITSDQQNPTHTYTSSGTFTVTLTVTDGVGIIDSDSTSATIKNLPSWVNAAIVLAGVTPSWDGSHFHAKIPFKNFQKLIGIGGSVPGDVNIKDFSGPYDFDFDWDNTYLNIDLYPYKPNDDKITLSGSAGVDIDAYKNLKLSAGVTANFEKVGDDFKWELCFNLNGRYEFPFLSIYSAIGPVPVSAQAKLYFDANAGFCLNSPDKFNNNVFSSVSGGLGIGATVRGGIGVVGAASVGLYTTVGGNWKFRAPEQDNSVYSSFYVSISFGAYAELIFVFDWEWEWFSTSWPSNLAGNTSMQSSGDDWGVMQRSYDTPTWVNNDEGVLLDDAFPMSHPNIDGNSNGDKMMVWTEDDLSKPAGGDGLDIWCSIWDKGASKWKAPQRIINDDLAQSNPTIAVLDNGHAISVFNCLTEPIGSRTVNEAAKASEIGYCYYDGSSWSVPQLIGATSGHFMDSYPVIASNGNKAVAVWMCDDNPSGITVNDRVLYASFWDETNWSTPNIIAEDNIISVPVSVSLKGDEAACAYAVDEDGNLSKQDDQNIYLSTFTLPSTFLFLNNNTIQITNGGRNNLPSVNYITEEGPSVIWVKEVDTEGNLSTTILYQQISNMLSKSGPEIVESGLNMVSSAPLFSSQGMSFGNNNNIPLVGWNDGRTICFKKRFPSGNWEPKKVLHMTSEEITQTAWEYNGTGDEVYAVFIEKDNITSYQDCKLRIAGEGQMLTPNPPSTPSGISNGYINENYEFSTSTIDPTPDNMLWYKYDWDDGNISDWYGPYNSESSCTQSHIWSSIGNYNIRVKARNNYRDSNWSNVLSVNILNHPPEKPTISGPDKGKPNEKLYFNFTSSDPDNDEIMYYVNWGDSTDWETFGPYISDKIATADHTWAKKGRYDIKVKAKDNINGGESEETVKEIIIKKSVRKSISKDIFFFQELLKKFPVLAKILNLLIFLRNSGFVPRI